MKQNKKVVYKATNKINNTIYIGFDGAWPRRKTAHKTKSKNGSKLYFHCAIRKYGWGNFEWEVLKEDATLKDEKRFILEYNANVKGIGYNQTEGGEGATGYKHSDENKKKIGQAGIGRQNTLGMRWKKTPEQIENSRQASLLDWIVTTPTGETIIISDLTSFCTEHGLSKQNMWKVSKGWRKHTRGYTCHKLKE